MRKNKIRQRFDPSTIIVFIVLLAYSVMLLTLLLWGLGASLKTKMQFRRDPFGIPKGLPWKWEWKNYSNAFDYFKVKVGTGKNAHTVYLLEMFVYSVLYAVGCSFASTAVPCVTGYMTAKYKFAFSKVIYTVVIIVMALPIIGSLPSEISVTKALNMYDTVWGVWLMKANFLGMYYLVFYAFFKGVSKEYYEAAILDGAGEFRIFASIIFPLAGKVFLTVMLIKGIEFWNDYQTPLIYTPSYPPVAYGLYLYNFSSDNKTSWPPMKITGAMLMMIPTLVMFLIFQNKLVGNISLGGVKE